MREIKVCRNPFLYSGHFNLSRQSSLRSGRKGSRNPFLYSGHFNEIEGTLENFIKKLVAIPSFIQGISTQNKETSPAGIYQYSRNPFLYSGNFNYLYL